MRTLFVIAPVVLAACGGGMTEPGVDGPIAACALPTTEGDGAMVAALAAQRCNVPGSMGAQHWFRLLGAMPSGPTDIVQLELWPNLGAFAGGAVHTGTFTITGADADPKNCGLCVRAVGHHGAADAQLYFATGGTVDVTSVGDAPAQFTADITAATFIQVDAVTVPIASGCGSSMTHIQVSGVVVDRGNTGGGGGGGGGTGTSGCVRTVGDI